jgi:16S rRNA G966 N2-methylase RsmD
MGEGAFSDLSVVFADPPYGTAPEMWTALAGCLRGYMAPGGVVVWECHRDADLPEPDGMALVDARRYGRSKFLFFQRG